MVVYHILKGRLAWYPRVFLASNGLHVEILALPLTIELIGKPCVWVERKSLRVFISAEILDMVPFAKWQADFTLGIYAFKQGSSLWHDMVDVDSFPTADVNTALLVIQQELALVVGDPHPPP
jgi:hypothetical protein